MAEKSLVNDVAVRAAGAVVAPVVVLVVEVDLELLQATRLKIPAVVATATARLRETPMVWTPLTL